MDHTIGSRQQKFRDKMKSDGKKQRVFFLSDRAMDAIKNQKTMTSAPSLNHALESLLADTGNQQSITRQAQKVADAFSKWSIARSSDLAANWANESSKLADLFKTNEGDK